MDRLPHQKVRKFLSIWVSMKYFLFLYLGTSLEELSWSVSGSAQWKDKRKNKDITDDRRRTNILCRQTQEKILVSGKKNWVKFQKSFFQYSWLKKKSQLYLEEGQQQDVGIALRNLFLSLFVTWLSRLEQPGRQMKTKNKTKISFGNSEQSFHNQTVRTNSDLELWYQHFFSKLI